MAWTTSACLRARLFLGKIAAAQLKKARLLYVVLRRSLPRPPWQPRQLKWHPSFAFALPLAALGLVSPLLPPALTASLLLAGGTGLALYSLRHRPSPARHLLLTGEQHARPHGDIQPSAPPPLTQTIDLERQLAPRQATPRARIPAGSRDRSWAELMARVNHDLRTPLNAVIGFSELMAIELFGPLGDERYQDYVHHIRDSATDLLKSAEDTLALTALMASPSRRGEVSSCDLEQLAAEAWAFVCRKAGARAVRFVACVPANLEVQGEPRVLRQVLVNMLSEAVARAAYGERVTLVALAEGELIELSVSVSKERSGGEHRGGSLAICLARTLLELQGTSLQEVDGAGHGWRAVTVLDRAAQPDFFRDRFGSRVRESIAVMAS